MVMYSQSVVQQFYLSFRIIFIHNVNESILCGLQMNTKSENGSTFNPKLVKMKHKLFEYTRMTIRLLLARKKFHIRLPT